MGFMCQSFLFEVFVAAVRPISFQTWSYVLRISANLGLVCRHFLQAGQSKQFTVLVATYLLAFVASLLQGELDPCQATLGFRLLLSQYGL